MKYADRLPQDDLSGWLQRHFAAADAPAWAQPLRDQIAAAHEHAGVRAIEPEMAETLRLLDELRADAEVCAAYILFTLQQCGIAVDLDAIVRAAPHVRELIEGQQAAEKVWSLYAARGTAGSAEGLRRLLLAIIRDLRVVFILLARQLARMRAAGAAPPERRRALAELTADIHAPLANRLGIWQLKWELEDIAFRYLHPDIYKRIASLLDERRQDRERYITDAMHALRSALADAGIAADIAGRPKHIYSIWKKMQRKGGDFSTLYDIRALRVLVADVPACYAALGVVHTLWPPVPSEFDDYIARPKGNHYQSLHTAVVGPEGKTLEVQIRSHDMHAHAEQGVAAHWRYKEGGGSEQNFERKVAWMRQLLEARDEHEDEAALLAGFRTDILEDRVYLLTPQGKVMDLPRGATVLDFAYHVHTDVGHRCRGAKVNGRIVPLTFQPASGDRVEILTGKNAEPRRDWLAPQHGFLNTHRAQQKVRTWFKHVDHAANLSAGRAILEKELKRLALANVDLDTLPPKFHQKTLDDFLVALALGEVTAGQVARVLHESHTPPPAQPVQAPRAPKRDKDAVTIEGVGNLLTSLARCCQPLPGDAIVGYITRGKGVSIHRADCTSFARLRARDPSRVIEVEWGGSRAQAYEVDLLVRGYDRKWLHKDVTNVIAAANVHLLAVNTRVDASTGLATMNFAVRVTDFEQLSTLLARLSGVPNVIEARRLA
ncbi:MAG TPA: bifunctional (p)ppGpp synthetase/guanosine-3',5'-bis(diphosphate) 3'-pyrophosphohydrolase [Rudaea sp.]|nr:bifunctional (p)ppGpp synthetase/guanosine-3',5'-bis(diphosphate) 3'-pyrophosphohydrolase [Rudaea sp.]